MTYSFSIAGDSQPLREALVSAEQVTAQVSCTVDHGGASCGWAHWAHTGEKRYAVHMPVPRWLGRVLAAAVRKVR